MAVKRKMKRRPIQVDALFKASLELSILVEEKNFHKFPQPKVNCEYPLTSFVKNSNGFKKLAPQQYEGRKDNIKATNAI